MRVLLTGAAGMVGRAVAPVLRAAGHEVISTDRPGACAGLAAPADLADGGRYRSTCRSMSTTRCARRILTGWPGEPR
jgi:nucleoside-diphosphate-sugar epimerase